MLRTANHDKEYLPISGLGDFTKLAAQLAYGEDSPVIKDGLVAATQSISGTGALRIGGAFLARHYPHLKTIYLPTPSWGNHTPLFRDSGLEVKGYRYFDKKTVGLDFAGLKEDLKVIEFTSTWQPCKPKMLTILNARLHQRNLSYCYMLVLIILPASTRLRSNGLKYLISSRSGGALFLIESNCI